METKWKISSFLMPNAQNNVTINGLPEGLVGDLRLGYSFLINYS